MTETQTRTTPLADHPEPAGSTTEDTTEDTGGPGPAAEPPDPEAALRELRRPVARLSRWGVVLGALGALGTLVPFIGIAELARELLAPGDIDGGAVATTVVVIVLGLALGWTLTGLALWLTHIADSRLQALLRRRMVDRLGGVGLGWYSSTTSGQVRKAAQNDLSDLHHLVAHHEVEVAGAIVLPLGGLGYLFWLDWRLGLLAMATLPVYALAYAFMMRGIGDKLQQMDTAFGQVSAAIVEFVQGIAVVKSFGTTGRAHHAYREATTSFGTRYAGWVRPMLRLEASTSIALSAPVVALVSLAGGIWFVDRGWVTPIDVLAEVLVALVVPTTLQTLNDGLTARGAARAAVVRIVTLLSTPVLPVAERPAHPQGNLVEFDRVTFRYEEEGRGEGQGQGGNGPGGHADPADDRAAAAPAPDADSVAGAAPGGPVDRTGRAALHEVSLTCRPGTVTALVGPSGAGKSTLAKLLLRFHDVTGGAIRVGGADIRDLAPDELYRTVGFVLQDVQLLHGTVADNLRLGRPDATHEELVAAATAAQIHDRILELPGGYGATVGEEAQFSGGEAQRLAIARALLADTPVLVLDEATAFADPESEARIQDALSAVAAGRTVLVIAHRLATIVGVDRIAVLDGGRVTETGTHRELLAHGGTYARMWEAYGGDTAADGTPRTGEPPYTGNDKPTGDVKPTGNDRHGSTAPGEGPGRSERSTA
ncbi:ABC transporter ATP-binding protein [Streptomyces sp. NPDC000594]|uniref:ABC transporter ATP-binding protein n=1 Tax=Streptomyces sp. NPDC000594 TaxID=3154261 RepID=UPI003326F6D9